MITEAVELRRVKLDLSDELIDRTGLQCSVINKNLFFDCVVAVSIVEQIVFKNEWKIAVGEEVIDFYEHSQLENGIASLSVRIPKTVVDFIRQFDSWVQAGSANTFAKKEQGPRPSARKVFINVPKEA